MLFQNSQSVSSIVTAIINQLILKSVSSNKNQEPCESILLYCFCWVLFLYFFLCCVYCVVEVVLEKVLIEIIFTCVSQVLGSINNSDHQQYIRLGDEAHSLQGFVCFWVTLIPRVTWDRKWERSLEPSYGP